MSNVPVVFWILGVFLVGALGGFFIMPPLLDRIDRVGKVGIMGW